MENRQFTNPAVGVAGQVTKEEGELLDNIFSYHAPFGTQVARYGYIRDAGKEMAMTVFCYAPGSPERTLALRAIQQAIMWANAAIAINEKPQP